MTISADLQMMAAELCAAVQAVGWAVTLTRRVSGAYSTATGSATVTSTVYTTTGVLASYRDDLVDGSLITRKDRMAVLSARSNLWSPSVPTPAAGDALTDTVASQTYNVLDMNPLYIQGGLVGWVLHLRTV